MAICRRLDRRMSDYHEVDFVLYDVVCIANSLATVILHCTMHTQTHSTTAQQHNSTTAQQHTSTPAQQHNSTPAHQHNCTTAQQHTSITAHQHTSTPAHQHTLQPGGVRWTRRSLTWLGNMSQCVVQWTHQVTVSPATTRNARTIVFNIVCARGSSVLTKVKTAR
jgi:hypothetical protein